MTVIGERVPDFVPEDLLGEPPPDSMVPAAYLELSALDKPPAPEQKQSQENVISLALVSIFGHAKHRNDSKIGTSRSRIVDRGVAGCGDASNSSIIYSVNPQSRTMAIAEGTGNEIGPITAAHGFERAMRIDADKQMDHSTNWTLGSVRRARDKLNVAIGIALGEDALGDDTSLSGVQIIDNKVFYTGHRPIFVYGPDGTCVNLTDVGTPEAPANGVHWLEPGRNIIVMSSGRTTDRDLSADLVANEISSALANNSNTSQAIAEHLEAMLSTDEASGTMLVSAVDVDPWVDGRSRLRRGADYVVRTPSTLAYIALTQTLFRRQHRRELYETNTRFGAIGRTAARIADVAFDAAAILGIATIAKNLAAPFDLHLPHLTDIMPHGGGHSSGTAPVHDLPTHTPDSAPPAPVDTPPANPPDHHPTIPADTFPDSRVAASHDPVSGTAANVSSWSQQAIDHYGHAAGLPQAEIDKMKHDPKVINALNRAFFHDPNGNNHEAMSDSHRWLYAGNTYSLHDQNAEAHQLTLKRAHQLGLDAVNPAPAAPAPQTPVIRPDLAPPAITQHILDSVPPSPTSARVAQVEGYLHAHMWSEIAAASLATAGTGVAVARRRSRNKKRDELRTEIESGKYVMPHGGKRLKHNMRLMELIEKSQRKRNRRATDTADKLRPNWREYYTPATKINDRRNSPSKPTPGWA